MGYGLVILDAWQENENLIDKLLEEKVISKNHGGEVMRQFMPARYCYQVESGFFPESDSLRYLPTAIVTNGKLVTCTRPLDITDLKDAQEKLNSFKDKKTILNSEISLLKIDINRLNNDKFILDDQIPDLQRKQKELTEQIKYTESKLKNLDVEKIEYINATADKIGELANNLEISATMREVTEFFNEIEKLKNLVSK